MRHLSSTYSSLGVWFDTAAAISPDGRYIVGFAQTYNPRGYLLDTESSCTACVAHDGDVDNNACVDDADLLAVLFAFGGTSYLGRADVNCDGQVDDSDLLTVLFNFGSGC